MESASHYKQCPRCGREAELTAAVCAGCGREFRTKFLPPEERTQMVGIVPATPPPLPDISAEPIRRTDICALLSLIFGSLGLAFWLIFGWLFGIAAIVL